MADKFKTPGAGTFLIVVVVLVGLGLGGWWGYKRHFIGPQHARIEELSILLTGHLEMTVVFKDALTEGDPRDVRLVFRSEALKEREFTMEWAEFAAAAMTATERLKPDQPPPLGVPIRVRTPVGKHFEEVMQGGLANTRNFKLTAHLFWAGTQQDRATTTVFFNYGPTAQ
jgi:hypothetical protein